MAEFKKLRLGEGDKTREYALMPMPPGKALYFIPKVTKALSPVLLGEGDLKSLTAGNADIASAAKLILGGLKQIDPEDLTSLAKDAISYECYAGPKKLSDPDHFDDWFSKNPHDMLQVMAWAIWENCKDFFPGGSEALEALTDRVKTAQESPSQKVGSQNT